MLAVLAGVLLPALDAAELLPRPCEGELLIGDDPRIVVGQRRPVRRAVLGWLHPAKDTAIVEDLLNVGARPPTAPAEWRDAFLVERCHDPRLAVTVGG